MYKSAVNIDQAFIDLGPTIGQEGRGLEQIDVASVWIKINDMEKSCKG